MKSVTVFVALLVLKLSLSEPQVEDTETYLSRFLADLWIEGADIIKIIWRDCSKQLIDVKDVIDHKEYFPKFMRCMKRKTLRALDRVLNLDLVPIAEGVNLVRFELVDRSGNVMPGNGSSTWSENDLEIKDWRTLALQRLARVLQTHVIKFELADDKLVEKAEQRGRRRHHMMTMMMFGIVSIGMVLIPMGFQFLAVLGGKALLLAKMALILASIQGLKKVDNINEGFHDTGKIASSPVNYGFYHTYSPYDHFDRRSNDGVILPAISLKSRHNNDIKGDKTNKAIIENTPDYTVTWKPIMSQLKDKHQVRHFTTHPEINVPNVVSTSIDAPTLVDLATNPGEVEADFALELPYNGLNFQNPVTVTSA